MSSFSSDFQTLINDYFSLVINESKNIIYHSGYLLFLNKFTFYALLLHKIKITFTFVKAPSEITHYMKPFFHFILSRLCICYFSLFSFTTIIIMSPEHKIHCLDSARTFSWHLWTLPRHSYGD